MIWRKYKESESYTQVFEERDEKKFGEASPVILKLKKGRPNTAKVNVMKKRCRSVSTPTKIPIYKCEKEIRVSKSALAFLKGK